MITERGNERGSVGLGVELRTGLPLAPHPQRGFSFLGGFGDSIGETAYACRMRYRDLKRPSFISRVTHSLKQLARAIDRFRKSKKGDSEDPWRTGRI